MAMIAEVPSETRERARAEEDARAERTTEETWALVANVSVTGLFALATLAALYLMKEVVVPVILAWVVANILLPVVAWMEKRGLPRSASVLIVALAMVAVVLTIVALLSLPLTYWLGRATELGALIKEKLQSMAQPLEFLKEILGAIGQATGQAGTGLHVEESTNIVGGIVSILTPAVTQGILFIGALIFYMIYQKQIKARSVLILPNRDARLTALKILSDIERNTTVYFGTFTIVNACLGLATTILAYAAGLPNPLLWGVLAAVLNYIPYIGPVIMVAVLFLIGLFTFPSISEALVAPLIYIAMTTIEGHFITPSIIGRRLTLSPFLVFLALVFWTWLWGAFGTFLATPLLIVGLVLLGHLFPKDELELPQ